MSLWNSIMGTIKEKSIRIETAREVFEAKDEYFIRNGAILLEKQITCNQGRDVEPIKIFSAKEIQQATNNYDPNLILGSAIAMVYKGTLDDREVAIKLISNGTLFDHLHGQCNEIPCRISWLDRVRIATETSYALCYMHYGRSRPIVHLDVKSSNIFLDESWTAKLTNFGFAVSIAPGEDFYQGSSIEGTVGYIDPEYQETLQVTEKCDVYSFGVVLVEVLTSQYPIEMFLVRQSYLIQNFVLSMAENRILQIVDDRVLSEGSSEDIQAFSELALRCVKNKGDERPTMREVTLELSRIQHLIRSKQNNGSGSAQTQLA
uniref:Protein kinase domain-containing protein n=1 Tax=Fagus sylvatica TaxID=28930 RepID=A0A2N9H8Y5_FAGSY